MNNMVKVLLIISQYILWCVIADGTKLDLYVQPEEVKISDELDENNHSIDESNSSNSHIILIYDNLTSNLNDQDKTNSNSNKLTNDNKPLLGITSKSLKKQVYKSLNQTCNNNNNSCEGESSSTRKSLIGKLLNLNPFRNENKSDSLYFNNNEGNTKKTFGNTDRKVKRKEIRELINRIKNRQPKYKGHLELLRDLEDKLNDPIIRENALISNVINVLNYVSRDNNLGLPPFINNVRGKITDNAPQLKKNHAVHSNYHKGFYGDFLLQNFPQNFLSSNMFNQDDIFLRKPQAKLYNEKYPLRKKNNTQNSGFVRRYKNGVKQYLNKGINKGLNLNNRNKRSKLKKSKSMKKQSNEVNKTSKLQKKSEKKVQNSSTVKAMNDNEEKDEETVTRRVMSRKHTHNGVMKKETGECETTCKTTTTEKLCTESTAPCTDETTTECETTTEPPCETTETECPTEPTECTTTTPECETTTTCETPTTCCKKKKPKPKKPKPCCPPSTTCPTTNCKTTKACEAEEEEDEEFNEKEFYDEECGGADETSDEGECEADDEDEGSTTPMCEIKKKTTVKGAIEIIDLDKDPNLIILK